MTPREFCEGGKYDAVKGAVHGAMFTGAVACCVYNASAFYYRRERHNALNALVYGLLIALELNHVQHHRRAPLHG